MPAEMYVDMVQLIILHIFHRDAAQTFQAGLLTQRAPAETLKRSNQYVHVCM